MESARKCSPAVGAIRALTLLEPAGMALGLYLCLLSGAAPGLAVTPAWITEGDQAAAHFGSSVCSAGDVNGDGYDDVLVGAPDHDNGLSDEGSASLYFGSPGGLSHFPAWAKDGGQDRKSTRLNSSH